MTEETKSTDIEKETGIGAYLWKQLYQQTVAFGGMIGGAYAGLLATKPFFKSAKVEEGLVQTWSNSKFLSKIPGLKSPPSLSQLKWGGGGGFFLGSLAATIVLGYEHWVKIKKSQLQVDEITKNISDIEVFKKTDPELKAENERLWAELHKRDKAHHAQEHGDHHKSMVDKHAAHKQESWQETAQAQSKHTAEASR